MRRYGIIKTKEKNHKGEEITLYGVAEIIVDENNKPHSSTGILYFPTKPDNNNPKKEIVEEIKMMLSDVEKNDILDIDTLR